MVSGKSIKLSADNVKRLFNKEPKSSDSINVIIEGTVVGKTNIAQKTKKSIITIKTITSKDSSKGETKTNTTSNAQPLNLNIYLDTIKATENETISQIKSKYGTNTDVVLFLPNGTGVATLNTTLKCISSDDKDCQIQVGSGNRIKISKSNVKKILNRDLNNGDSVKVKIDITIDKEKSNEYKVTLQQINSGIGTIHNTESESNDSENESESESESESGTSDGSDEDEVTWWEDKWDDLTNIMGHLKIKLLDLILTPFDAIQSAINSIQTAKYSKDDKMSTWTIVMEPSEIKADANKNKYADYSKGAENLGSSEQKKTFINVKNDGLQEVTTIPIIPVESYTIANGQIDLFDINFLNGQNNTNLHSSGSGWLTLRNVVSGIMHVIIYIGSAVLIIVLILHGIALVKDSLALKALTPEERAKHSEGLKEFTKSAIMLVATVVIMGISIFLTETISKSAYPTNPNELPIRVNVGEGEEDGKNNDYSFSTNLIGYFRFMAQINQPKKSDFKAFYVVMYIFLVFINMALVFIMIVRLIMIAGLSIIGPVIAIANAFNKKDVMGMTFLSWTINYLIISAIQVVVAIVSTITIKITF